VWTLTDRKCFFMKIEFDFCCALCCIKFDSLMSCLPLCSCEKPVWKYKAFKCKKKKIIINYLNKNRNGHAAFCEKNCKVCMLVQSSVNLLLVVSQNRYLIILLRKVHFTIMYMIELFLSGKRIVKKIIALPLW
jgi:hypothetical protein